MQKKNFSELAKLGWIPNYHGAWAMVLMPIILGIVKSGWVNQHLLLLAFWILGYFAFFALAQWLHFRYARKYLPAVKTYIAIIFPLGLALAFVAPFLLFWIILFLPLTLIALLAAKLRKERSLWNDITTIIAGCLTLPLAYELGVNAKANFDSLGLSIGGLFGTGFLSSNATLYPTADWLNIWLITALLAAYFIGTVFYVKTNIRERKSNGYLASSVIYHALISYCVLFLINLKLLDFHLLILWILLTIRALAVPLYGRKVKWLSPKHLGLSEMFFSIWLFISFL